MTIHWSCKFPKSVIQVHSEMTKTTFDLRMRNEKIQIFRLSQIKDEFFHR